MTMDAEQFERARREHALNFEEMKQGRMSKSDFICHTSDLTFKLFLMAAPDALLADLEASMFSSSAFSRAFKKLYEDFSETLQAFEDVYRLETLYSFVNSVAKRLLLEADVYEFKDPDKFFGIRKTAFRFYEIKNRITVKILETALRDDVRFQAYPIRLKSADLNDRIVEIVFEETGMILHAKSEEIVELLERERLLGEARISRISDYVNTRI